MLTDQVLPEKIGSFNEKCFLRPFKQQESGLLFALDGTATPSVLSDLYCLSKQKRNRKFVNYRKRRVNSLSKIGSNKELLLEPPILLLINNSYLPHDIWFFETHISYSLNIHGSSRTWIWILLAKSVYSDCPYALGVTVSPFQRQKEKNITVSQ